MMGHAWGQFGVMPPIMHPTQRVGVRELIIDRRIITEQPARHGHLSLGVIRNDRQHISDLLLLLAIERQLRRGQVLLEVGCGHVRVTGQGVAYTLHQRGRQAAG
jgi:hypothetical protein